MTGAAALFIAASHVLGVADFRELAEREDVRAVETLERVYSHLVEERRRFPAELPIPAVEAEMVACLEALARLDLDAAGHAAAIVVDDVPCRGPCWTARRIVARRGDIIVVRRALDDFLAAPARWRLVLAEAARATGDARLADFLPGGVALHGGRVSSRLRRSRILAALGDPPSDEIGARDRSGDTLREAVERDDARLARESLEPEALDGWAPYFAWSRHREARERLASGAVDRGAALAALLLSPRPTTGDKRRYASEMEDAWAGAIAAGAYEALVRHVGAAKVEAKLSRSASTTALEDTPSVTARERLAEIETPVVSSGRSLRQDPLGERPLADAVRAAAERSGRQPEALAAMHRLYRLEPDRLLDWLDDSSPPELRKRTQFVLSLSGDPTRLPLLVELAVLDEGSVESRESGFRGLSEQELGRFDKRLHRFAGDPDPSVRFQTAVALTPTGEGFALRLLLAELSGKDARSHRRARLAVERLNASKARALLEAMILDGTITLFGVERYLALGSVRPRWRAALWSQMSAWVDTGDGRALEAAARLGHPEASARVRQVLAQN